MSVTVFPPRNCDPEVAAIMDELSKLQTWLVMLTCQSRGDPMPISAAGLVQRTRCLIVERCYTTTPTAERITG